MWDSGGEVWDSGGEVWDSGGEVWGRDGAGCEVRCGLRDGVTLVERWDVQLGKGGVRCPLSWGGIVEVRVNKWFCGRAREGDERSGSERHGGLTR